MINFINAIINCRIIVTFNRINLLEKRLITFLLKFFAFYAFKFILFLRRIKYSMMLANVYLHLLASINSLITCFLASINSFMLCWNHAFVDNNYRISTSSNSIVVINLD